MILFLIFPVTIVEAQITPDGSLPTSVEQQGENELNINGGEREGNNLFHSFEEFSVPDGIEAVFENATDIENIFTRITGNSVSNINGILRTQGGANFFLVNPNGIVFGKNARLDIGGSFVATTGKSIQFEDGTEFASSAEEKPILTVSVPIGVQFEGNSGGISVNGGSSQTRIGLTPPSPIEIVDNEKGLSVASGNTLALIGNNVDINGGVITTVNGNAEIVSINKGDIDFQSTENGLNFSYDNVENFQNITFDNKSLLYISDNGKINLNGANVELADGSLILLQNSNFNSLGSINIDASESLIVEGTTTANSATNFSSLRTETTGEGNAGNINVLAKNLLLEDGGSINALTFGKGESGDVNLSVANSFEITGVFQAAVNSSVLAATYADGNSGNVRVLTEELIATDGSIISSSSFGTGNGGNVWVAANEIELSGIGSNIVPTGITTNSVNIGKSGNVTIETSELILSEGATVNSTSLSGSGAGNVFVNASDSINVSGQKQNFFSTISSAIVTVNEDIQSVFMIPEISSGNSGNVTINTPLLNIARSGSISVRNERIGEAGRIFIDAGKINLGNTGSVNAISNSGIGGEINLKTNQLRLDENSTITATAKNNGNSGNISISTGSLIAQKNSEVTANAFQGSGGNISIDAEGLFLFDSSENIFSASSELGVDGAIQINTPDITLQPQLEILELKLVATDKAITNSCLARSSQQGSFTINDNGGLPKNPNSNYSDAGFSLTGVNRLTSTTKQPSEIPENSRQQNSSAIPAQRMVETESGRIFLVAAPQKPESLYCQSAEGQEK